MFPLMEVLNIYINRETAEARSENLYAVGLRCSIKITLVGFPLGQGCCAR